MDEDLLKLALVNHALGHGLGTDKAWPLVGRILDEAQHRDVRALAAAVQEAAADAVHGSLYMGHR